MKRLLAPLWFLLASLFLLEAWLWDRLGPLVRRFVDWAPWRPLTERLSRWLAALRPYPALACVAVPMLMLIPLKFVEVALVIQQRYLLAILTLLLAKLLGMGIASWLFAICKPALLQIDWVARAYATVLRALDWAHAKTAPYRRWLQRRLAAGANGRQWLRLRRLRRWAQRRTRETDL
ncbi:hypothetical protein QU487_03045 [Crenobacter sp. SG2305]|uniref:hypothetical protein n=1 Tax=Crenobacter oryzisoli TaxID=3056844 RepID=UPI0025AADBBD|nr:hypothetical protein [Crenobacter sp. SG2305]MDN0081740.1 hypothetical protein [Crenobacter sp. SG2305]